LPPLPLYDWQRELFEVALDETMPDLYVEVVQIEGWTPELSSQLQAQVLPDVAATAARGRSRITRPPLPLPRDCQPLTREASLVQVGPYRGWLRVAYWEQELQELAHWHQGRRIDAEVGLWSGVGNPPASLPFEAPPPGFRWHDQLGFGSLSLAPLQEGWIAMWWIQRDSLAWDHGLTLREDIREALGLTAAPVPAAFDLIDATGATALAYRRWRMRPYSYDYHPVLPLLTGGELLLRPDLAERLRRRLRFPLVEVVRVTSQDLSKPTG
jgi:hypothetical protein